MLLCLRGWVGVYTGNRMWTTVHIILILMYTVICSYTDHNALMEGDEEVGPWGVPVGVCQVLMIYTIL